MKNLLLCLCITFTMNSETSNLKIQNTMAVNNYPIQGNVMNILTPYSTSEPYELKLNINKQGNETYELEIKMILNNNSYFVSPNAKRSFSGKFTVAIDENSKFELLGDLIETPLSKEENDPHPFVRGLVNWVRVNTTYSQQLQLSTKEDFEVMGFIQFTIEPQCTLEKIPVIIKSKDGVLKFEVFQC